MLFRKKMEQHCAYCAHCGKVSDEQMICAKKGLVDASGRCRRFRYDPLKRVPARPKPQSSQGFSAEDFQL